MKVTIEYDGNEEQEEIQLALDGYKWKNAMWELDQELRKVTKYSSSLLPHVTLASEQEIVVAEAVRKYLRHILTEYNLNLDI
jgi:hypothetical protein